MIEGKANKQIFVMNIVSDEDEDQTTNISTLKGNTASSLTIQTQPTVIRIKRKQVQGRSQSPQQQGPRNKRKRKHKAQSVKFSDQENNEEQDKQETVKSQLTSQIYGQSSNFRFLQKRQDNFQKQQKQQEKEEVDSNQIHYYSRSNQKKRIMREQSSQSENQSGEENSQQQSDEESIQTSQYIQQLSPTKNKFKKIQVIRDHRLNSIQLTFSKQQINKLIMTPVPQGFTLPFIIQSSTNFLGFKNKYQLAFQSDPHVVLSAKKEVMSLYPTFLISKSAQNHSRRSTSFVGKLEGNFSGSQWMLSTPKKSDNQQKQYDMKLMANYGSSILGFKSIRAMSVYKQDPKYKKKSKYTIKEKVEANKPIGLIKLNTAVPILRNGFFKLDFQGKAKMASNKNFILTHGEKECLLMGKQKEDSYLMEIRYPLSILQGFSLCLTSLEGKLLVN